MPEIKVSYPFEPTMGGLLSIVGREAGRQKLPFAHYRRVMEKSETNVSTIMELLKAAGLDADAALATLREAKKEATDGRKAALIERKESNKELVLSIATDIRASLEEMATELLPGSHLNFTVRVPKDGGAPVATANDCHATGDVVSIHVTSEGETVFGPEGAESAKNVRPRKK